MTHMAMENHNQKDDGRTSTHVHGHKEAVCKILWGSDWLALFVLPDPASVRLHLLVARLYPHNTSPSPF